jgi:hypothetical protein
MESGVQGQDPEGLPSVSWAFTPPHADSLLGTTHRTGLLLKSLSTGGPQQEADCPAPFPLPLQQTRAS